MIYRFIMLSDEVDNFRREYKIDGDATFLELQQLITQSTGYNDKDLASFYICANDWTKETEITLFEMNTKSEEDSLVMSEVSLSEYLEEERQKLMYVFDYLNERAFYMELREIIFGENLDEGEVSKSIGKAPLQSLPIEEEPVKVIPTVMPPADDDDLFDDDDESENYTDDGYNEDELDADGFGDEDMGEENMGSEDDFGSGEIDI